MTEDMVLDNWGGYGRVFRNIKGIIKDYFKELPYFDWPLNYELSKYGKIKQDNFFGGYYRISEKGNFTLSSEIENSDTLKVSFVGYETFRLTLKNILKLPEVIISDNVIRYNFRLKRKAKIGRAHV